MILGTKKPFFHIILAYFMKKDSTIMEQYPRQAKKMSRKE